MIDKKIHLLVQEKLKGLVNTVEEIKESVHSDLDQRIYASAKRVINNWEKQLESPVYKADFECSLRNYLLLVRKDIELIDYIPSGKFSDLGLEINKKTGSVRAVFKFPSFSNEQLIKSAYSIEHLVDKRVSNNCLNTNFFIRDLTGFVEFKSYEQKIAVTGALRTPEGYTCLVSLSTGGGKSLITQTVSYQNYGLTIIVVPTISLMLDQYNNARYFIKHDTSEEIFYYHSDCDLSKFYKSLEEKKAKMLFLSPESLIKNRKLRSKIEEINKEKYLKNIIIDEAHIIVEWGASFRIDFQCLDALRSNLMVENNDIRTYLLSATYSDYTIKQLQMFYSKDSKWIEVRCEKLRHETRFDVIKCTSYGEKNKRIMEAIDLLPHPMIVYVKSPDDAEQLKSKLVESGYNNINTFTGKTSDVQRTDIIDTWKKNKFDLMIATCAFGVGVDKKDVRTVLHTYIPETPNKYYQEAGRGGRDGFPCLSTIIYIDKDIDAAFSFVSKVMTTEKLMGRWFSILNSKNTYPVLGGKYLIDTYVKPDYNTDEEFIDSISNQDINWNVNVILFMRRNGMLSIDDISYNKEKYVFYVTIIDRSILVNSEETRLLIDSLRDHEWKITLKEFSLMKKNLQNVGKICWSSMFTEIYRKTDEYCAGCNEHLEVQDSESNKTLKKNVDNPLANIDSKMLEESYGSLQSLIIKKENLIDKLTELQLKSIDVIVADENLISRLANRKQTNNKFMYYNYGEFLTLTVANKFFVSGVIIIVVPKENSIQKNIISVVQKSKSKIQYILCTEEDYYLNFRKKKLSEVIERSM